MFWTLSFQLHPDESIIEKSRDRKTLGTDPLYSVFLTNKRIIFRFNSLGSSLTQSFFLDEIVDAVPCKRLLISYIKITTSRRSFFLNISEPRYWSEKIKSMKGQLDKTADSATTPPAPSSRPMQKSELLQMLATLKANSLLNDLELEEKVRMLESGSMGHP